MTTVEAPTEAEIAELQTNLQQIFARARSYWRDAAQRIHPDLQPTGYKLLSHINRTGGTNAYHLAETFELDKSAISRQVRMLEELGLVTSRPDEHDGRIRVLTATEAARERLAEAAGAYSVRLRSAIEGLAADEVRAAAKVFRVLGEA